MVRIEEMDDKLEDFFKDNSEIQQNNEDVNRL